jgi:hypothetical protein
MPEIKSYEPGRFCWVELATSDAKAAGKFYSSLFGWKVQANQMGDEGIYYMFQKDGNDVGAMYEEKNAPPHWNNYISVADADASAEKAKKLGGRVVAGPFDAKDFGRMAAIRDPQNASFSVWQPKKHIGATVINETNAMCWNELMTNDIDAARKFYTALFGWKLKESPEYTEVHVGKQATGGMMPIGKEQKGMTPNWKPYFAVDDADATAKKIKSAGGQVHVPPTDIPKVGRFSIVMDPQGAVFAIIKPMPA